MCVYEVYGIHIFRNTNMIHESLRTVGCLQVEILCSGADVNIQSYLTKHICQPSSTCGLRCISMSGDKHFRDLIQHKITPSKCRLDQHAQSHSFHGVKSKMKLSFRLILSYLSYSTLTYTRLLTGEFLLPASYEKLVSSGLT